VCVCLDLYFTILSLLVFFLSSEYAVDMTWNLWVGGSEQYIKAILYFLPLPGETLCGPPKQAS
jgi:hypothetical protein